jgi:hypothetical protein
METEKITPEILEKYKNGLKNLIKDENLIKEIEEEIKLMDEDGCNLIDINEYIIERLNEYEN